MNHSTLKCWIIHGSSVTFLHGIFGKLIFLGQKQISVLKHPP